MWKVATNWGKQSITLCPPSSLHPGCHKKSCSSFCLPFCYGISSHSGLKTMEPSDHRLAHLPSSHFCPIFPIMVNELKTIVLGCHFLHSEYFIDFLLVFICLFWCYLYPIWIFPMSWLIFRSLYNIYFWISIQHDVSFWHFHTLSVLVRPPLHPTPYPLLLCLSILLGGSPSPRLVTSCSLGHLPLSCLMESMPPPQPFFNVWVISCVNISANILYISCWEF